MTAAARPGAIFWAAGNSKEKVCVLQGLKLKVLCSLLALAMAGQAWSDEKEKSAAVFGNCCEEWRLHELLTVSVATGRVQPLHRAPAVASVITAEDISAMGAVDLDEVLETVPGVHVARSANLYSPLYVMRGIYSQYNAQTLMLQNGVPMTTLLVGNRGNIWAGLPLENISRIEIIRGPGSALYGADAYSGVINIITKRAAEVDGTQLGVRMGSNHSRDSWLQHGGQWGAIEVAAYLRGGSSDGFKGRVDSDAQSLNDKNFNTLASGAPCDINTGYQAIDGSLDLAYGQWRLRGGYKLRDDVGTAAGIAYALDPIGKAKSERVTADLSWADAQLNEHWGAGATASYLHYDQRVPTPFRLFPAGAAFPNSGATNDFPNGVIAAPETSERQSRLSAFASYSGMADHQWRFGIGHDDLNMYATRSLNNFTQSAAGLPIPSGLLIDYSTTAPFTPPQRRRLNYLYVQDEWQLAKAWTLTAGLRRDQYSDVGGTTNPRLALVWEVDCDLSAKLLYGQAFRAPAFNELYSLNNPVLIGNPALKPETIRTYEAAFAWQSRVDTLVNLNFFHYDMRDIVRTVVNPTVGTGSTFHNIGNQSGKGMELEVLWDARHNLRLAGNYAYQHAIDEATGSDAGYAPRHHLYGRADWTFANNWLAGGQLNRVTARKRPVDDLRADLAGYTTFDATLRNNRGKNNWSFAASLRNLFNAKVVEPSLAPGAALPNDLPMAPRTFYLQASYAL
jgi:iron complex outermembrane receptor protein